MRINTGMVSDPLNTSAMGLSNGEGSSELFHAHISILNQTLSMMGTMALKCAVELGVADIIESYGRPVSLSELARSIPIPPKKDQMLRRLMRLLVARGVFTEKHEATYVLTPFSRLLLRKGVGMSAYVLALLDHSLWAPLFAASAWFCSEGESTPFELANGGRALWEVMNERPELNDQFNMAMASNALWVVKMVVSQHPDVFRGLKSLVDVGGGTGTAAQMIADAFPGITCTIFDLPHVIAKLPEGTTVDAVKGDMFDCIPPANATFLKSILHDWGDEDCVKILKRCKEAIPAREEGGKVIIVDMVVNHQSDQTVVTETQLLYDVAMMLGLGGKEREEHEWRKIFNDAGFKEHKIFPLMGIHSIIELYP